METINLNEFIYSDDIIDTEIVKPNIIPGRVKQDLKTDINNVLYYNAYTLGKGRLINRKITKLEGLKMFINTMKTIKFLNVDVYHKDNETKTVGMIPIREYKEEDPIYLYLKK